MLKVISIQTASVVTITASGENGGTCRLSVLGKREDAGLTARLRVNRPGARRAPGVPAARPGSRVAGAAEGLCLPLAPDASASRSPSLSLSLAVPSVLSFETGSELTEFIFERKIDWG